ncbi:MAG TPA: winged helix-turn-helix domain-containing protein [Bryobacteraceae bacterium]|nr:winged helix-turn-helix domain-containing protein [Bryobacteraceae bacterium]
MKERALFKFGSFALDPVAKVLFRDGEPVHLTRKSVETLLVLVENSGRVLTKEEIMSAVWGDRVVDEANLAQNIAVVRKALGASKGSPAHIETFPGRGYRLEGPVTSTIEERIPDIGTKMLNEAPISPAVIPDLPSNAPSIGKRNSVLIPVALGFIGVLAGVAFLWNRSATTAPPDDTAFRVMPATRMPGKEYQPVLTRDGKRIAFLSAEDGLAPPSVWVQDSEGGGSRQLTKTASHHSSPVWSPDGIEVAFLRVQPSSTEIVISSSDGSAQRVVAQMPGATYGFDHRMLDWAPGGQWLAVSHALAPGASLALYLIHAKSGERRSLTVPGTGVVGDVDPRFSPDGSTVSFVRLIHRSQQEIFTVQVKSGHTKRLTNLGKRISGHDWTRDGKSLVFASDRRGDFRLWRLKLNGNDEGRSAAALPIYSEFPLQLSTARAADALVYSSLHQDRNIWRFDLKTLTWKRTIASSGQDASPQYSPSGDRICFRSDRSGEEQLWVSNADGSNGLQVTRSSNRPSVGRWSPDGSSIVFNSPQTGEVYIATKSTDNTWSVRNIRVQGIHPVFSPDGGSIYAGGPSAIVRFDVRGGSVEQIVQTKGEALALSRDGRYLYFVREPNDTALWRVELGKSTPTRVLDGLVPGCTSCWALVENGVYFLGSDKQSFDRQMLFFHDLRTNRDRVVAPYPEPLWPLGSGPFSISPDAQTLLSVRVEPSNSDAMLVTPFR